MERIKWIDIAKGIGILLVIIGHMVEYNTPLTKYIYSFHMPLFFILSGLCFNQRSCLRKKQFIKKKFKTLILTYIYFVIIALLFTVIRNGFNIETVLNLYSLKQVVWLMHPIQWNAPQLWFLPCIFFVEIIYYCFIKDLISVSGLMKLLIPLILGVISTLIFSKNGIRLPWKIDVAMVALMFYISGIYLQSFKPLKTVSLRILVLGAIVAFTVSIISGVVLNKSINMADMNYGNYVYFLFSSYSGAILVIFTSKTIGQSKVIEFLGRNTLIIFTTHSFIMTVIVDILSYFSGTPYRVYHLPLFIGLVCSLVTIITEVLIVKIISKIKSQ